MATNNKIARLSARIDALASRRWGRLTMESLTDEGWAKVERLAAGERVGRPDDLTHWTTDALLRFLVDDGVLSMADFRSATVSRP